MANNSSPSAGFNSSGAQGLCPRPFLQGELFPATGGFIKGRFCNPYSSTNGSVTCCLPCPVTYWVYPDGFEARTKAASWINVAALFATVFLLLSFWILPVKWTHRHYLSICLVIAVGFMQLAFIIPLAAKPAECHNAITPNDMHSSGTCAVTGAFLLFGGWGTVMWVFYRALSLHLQICWEAVPGRKFFYSALVIGWGIPAIGLTLALTLTGVSYRFGTTCHINHDTGLQDFWGPLLAFAAASLIIQVVTLVYCIQVYVRSLFDDNAPTTETSSALPSYSGSTRAATARQAYRRVKRVIALQWRGVAIVLLIIAWVVFFSIVFVSMDSNLTQAVKNNGAKLEPWLVCLVFASGNSVDGDKTQCLDKLNGIVTNQATVLAVLVCLATSGFFNLLFLGRWSMVEGWKEYFRSAFSQQNEFVSADARRMSHDHRAYEMLSGTGTGNLKAPETAFTNQKEQYPTESDQTDPYAKEAYPEGAERINPLGQNATFNNDYFTRDAKMYTSPVGSFSSPRPPSSAASKGWDPQSTYARGHRFY